MMAAAEAEWWFDTERLHLPTDLERMQQASLTLMAIKAFHPVMPPRHSRALELQISERPPHDLAREMEMVLYGGAGGYGLKLERARKAHRSAIALQASFRLRVLKKRVAERVHQKREKAVKAIQDHWRRRKSGSRLAFGANLLGNLSLSLQREVRGLHLCTHLRMCMHACWPSRQPLPLSAA